MFSILFTSLIPSIFLYLLGSFVFYSWDIGEWDMVGRMLFAVFNFLLTVALFNVMLDSEIQKLKTYVSKYHKLQSKHTSLEIQYENLTKMKGIHNEIR